MTDDKTLIERAAESLYGMIAEWYKTAPQTDLPQTLIAARLRRFFIELTPAHGVTDEMVERVARALWERLTCSFTFDEARDAKHPQYDWIVGDARDALEAVLAKTRGAS